MITNQCYMSRLAFYSVDCYIIVVKMFVTPFMMGIKDAGSVDIEASSRNTTGKSIIFSAMAADVIHVVQI